MIKQVTDLIRVN